MTFNSIKISDAINFRTSSKRLERALVSHLTSSFKIINVMICGLAVPQSLLGMCPGDFGGSFWELWVRGGGGAGAPGVRLGQSHITRRHGAPRWGGTCLHMWKRNNCRCLSPCSGPQICTGGEEATPPSLPRLFTPQS